MYHEYFFSKSYSIIYTDEDLAEINSCTLCYNLAYKGRSEDFKFRILYVVKYHPGIKDV